jgi:hypothetical protein
MWDRSESDIGSILVKAVRYRETATARTRRSPQEAGQLSRSSNRSRGLRVHDVENRFMIVWWKVDQAEIF